jgi:GT2 family glycosyltransferase
MAVHRGKFLELGGFDPLFLPGRYEDLDLAFRGWLRGYKAVYVPHAVAYHKGRATFGLHFGARGIDRLDVRNSLLFAWKNLHTRSLLAQHLAFLVMRIVHAVLAGHGTFLTGLASAVRMLPSALASRSGGPSYVRTERELFAMLRYAGDS